jgi:hypothetical protein
VWISFPNLVYFNNLLAWNVNSLFVVWTSVRYVLKYVCCNKYTIEYICYGAFKNKIKNIYLFNMYVYFIEYFVLKALENEFII